jgi:hypothetical protein
VSAGYSGDETHVASTGLTALRILAPKPSNAFALSKPKLNKRKGTATLTATVPGPGRLVLEGKGIKKQTKTASSREKVELTVKPTKKLKQKLNRTGKAKVPANVTFTPTGGDPNTKSTRLRLRLRRS